MLLSDVCAAGEYSIEKVLCSSAQKTRLCRLLIAEKRTIKVLFSRQGKAVVCAGGTMIGLSESICEKIEIKALNQEKRRGSDKNL